MSASKVASAASASGLGARGRVRHAPAGPVAIEAVGDVKDLLAVVLEREVEEGAAGERQLHGGAEAALHDPQVAAGQVLVEIVDVRPRVETGVGGERSGSMRGPQKTTRRASGRSAGSRPGRRRLGEEVSADGGAAGRSHHEGPVGLVAETLAQARAPTAPFGSTGSRSRRPRSAPGPSRGSGEPRAEGLGDEVLVVAQVDRPVPHPRIAGHLLDHLGVVVGGQLGLAPVLTGASRGSR